jgi:hypothetical protein
VLDRTSHHNHLRKRKKKRLGAMDYAKTASDKFQRVQTGYHNELYTFFGMALISYRKFLNDKDEYKELLSQDNISRLREKPELKKTSRLVLYYLTHAQSPAERNTAGKYARIVDYLQKERIKGAGAADHIRELGGMDAILKKARGREALKVADEPLDGDRDFGQAEEPDETRIPASVSEDMEEGLFDPEKDLAIRVKPETRERILNSDIGVDRSFHLQCRKKGPVGREGIRITGRLVEDPELS